MVRCRAKGENYSYDFAASLQNTNGQSILISERDLTAWKGAAERMLTNEIVLKVFSDYLNRDTDFEVVLTSKGYTVMGFDNHRQDWNTVDFCPTPEDLLDSLLDAYENFRMMEITTVKTIRTVMSRYMCSFREMTARSLTARCLRNMRIIRI